MITKRYIILLFTWVCIKSSPLATYNVTVTDQNFLKFIIQSYPQVLDYSGTRIIASKAATITGCFDAPGYNISNADGIQCFTALTKIDLHNNKLSNLPDLSGCNALQSLNVAQNKLQQLPALNTLPNLTELIAYGNLLKSLPDLSSNSYLKQIILNNNQIEQIPSLQSLPLLTDLVLDNNLLTQLPNLGNCKMLAKLSCAGNAITQAPVLDSLKALEILDLSYNKLSMLPNMSFNVSLQQAYFNNNKIKYIYNSPVLYSLQKVRLYNNDLTFSSLNKLLACPDYKTVFEISPQNSTYTSQNLSTTRMDTLHITTGIDAYVQNVKYQWYKNGAFYKNCTYDYFSINNLSYADSGIYYCEIKHDSFPSISLRSDNYSVKVKNCVNTNALTLTISSADCDNSGKLSIVSDDSQKLQYILERNAQHRSDTSANGQFKSLMEGNYTLQILTQKGCLAKYPKDVTIPKEECNYPVLTPNDDGDRDTYYFDDEGEVIIYDKQGNVIKTISTPGFWDASSSKNGKVRSGLYVADINKGKKIIKISVVY